MGTLYTSNPVLHGMPLGTSRIESFSLDIIPDGDMVASLSVYDMMDNDVHAQCSGRVRGLNGGGIANHMHAAFMQLAQLIERDVAVCGDNGQMPPDGLLMLPHAPHTYVEWYVDDRGGYFGMDINDGGEVRLHQRPFDDDDGFTAVEVLIKPDTPYQHSYGYMTQLWQAITRDAHNNLRVNHA